MICKSILILYYFHCWFCQQSCYLVTFLLQTKTMFSSFVRENWKSCHSQQKRSIEKEVLILKKMYQLTSFSVKKKIKKKAGLCEVLVKYKSNTCQPAGLPVSLLSHLQKHTPCQLLYLAWPGNKNPLDRKSTVELAALFLLVPFHLLV